MVAGWVLSLYPGGSQELFAGDEFAYKQAPCKMVLHTTETAGFPKYARNKAPHVTANPKTRQWRQHRPLNKPSWSLAVGSVSTNSMGAIQVEIIGYAATMKDLDQASLDWLGGLIRMLMQQSGIPMQSSVSFGGSETYGTNGTVRLSAAAWTNYRGILGHQHVPNNSHWDPGNLDGNLPFNQSRWFKAIAGTPAPEPPQPVVDEDDKMLAFGKEENDPHIWVGDGVTRRWVEDQSQLADLFYKIDTGVFKGDKTVVVSPDGRLGWLGAPYPPVVSVDVDEAEIAEAVIEAINGEGLSLSPEGLAKIVAGVKQITYKTTAE